MKNNIIFAASCLIATCAFSQATSPQGSVLAASGGRFVFGQISEYRRDQYLLDTQTGRVWMKVCAAEDKDDKSRCAISAMSPLGFVDSSGNFSGPLPSAGK